MIAAAWWLGMALVSYAAGVMTVVAVAAQKRRTFANYVAAVHYQAELLDMRSERLSTGDVLDDRGFREPVDPWPTRQSPTDQIDRVGMVVSRDVAVAPAPEIYVVASPLLAPETPVSIMQRASRAYVRHGGIGLTIALHNLGEALRPAPALPQPVRLHHISAERTSARIIINRLRAEERIPA